LNDSNIGGEGCRYLSEAKWSKLSTIMLGNTIKIKTRIILEIRDAAILQEHAGI